MQCFTLSNGVKIPAVGSGTNSFAKTDGVFNGSTKEVISAIEAGYTFSIRRKVTVTKRP